MQEKAPELPIGLGMALAQNTTALNRFGGLGTARQQELVRYIQGATSGNDAKARIETVVSDLTESF